MGPTSTILMQTTCPLASLCMLYNYCHYKDAFCSVVTIEHYGGQCRQKSKSSLIAAAVVQVGHVVIGCLMPELVSQVDGE